jgi:hypothetical protein
MENEAPSPRKTFPVLATSIALLLAVFAAIACFDVVQQSSSYVAAVRDQFYTPIANPPHESWIERALAPGSLALLQFALWPFVIFLGLETGASYGFGRAFLFEGEHLVLRRSLAGLATSLLATGVFLAALWQWLESKAAR